MKTTLTALLAICLCWGVGCGGNPPAKEDSDTLESPKKHLSFDEIKAKAEAGNADAQFEIAGMYRKGEGVSQDREEALKWIRKAATHGHARAQDILGSTYRRGDGVAQDYEEAVNWYRKAAEQGYARAQNNLAVFYANGFGLPKDFKEAAKWWRKAAEQGNAGAQITLGAIYANGQGVLQDYVTAYAWANIAQANGDKTAPRFKSEFLEGKMTPDQIAKAEELAREMIKKNPKLLGK